MHFEKRLTYKFRSFAFWLICIAVSAGLYFGAIELYAYLEVGTFIGFESNRAPRRLMLLLVFALIIGIAVWSFRKRSSKMKAFAQENGFEYLGASPQALPAQYQNLKFVKTLRRKKQAAQVIRGTLRDRPVLFFDAVFKGNESELGSDLGSRSALIIELERNFPGSVCLALKNGWFDPARVMDDDILSFELAEFDRIFLVSGEPPKLAHALVAPSVIEHILSTPTFSWEIRGNHLCVYETFETLEPDRLLHLHDYSRELLSRIPDFVWKESQDLLIGPITAPSSTKDIAQDSSSPD